MMTTIQTIQKKVAEVQEKFAKAGYPSFPIYSEITKLGRGIAGQARYSMNGIFISEAYIKEFPDEVLNVTVPHEVCHLYVNRYMRYAKQAHGPEFRDLMRFLGLPGKTHHNMKLVNGPVRKTRAKYRYIYKTVDGVYDNLKLTSQQHNKIQRGIVLSYRGKMLTWTGIRQVFK